VTSSDKNDILGKQIESEQSEKFNISLKKFSFLTKTEDFKMTIAIDYRYN